MDSLIFILCLLAIGGYTKSVSLFLVLLVFSVILLSSKDKQGPKNLRQFKRKRKYYYYNGSREEWILALKADGITPK